jgi:hypothetical protein
MYNENVDKVANKGGRQWIAGKDAAYILRRRKFLRLDKGPKWAFLVPVIDTVAFKISLLPETTLYTAEGIQTQDGLQVSVETKLEYRYDSFELPQGMPQEKQKTWQAITGKRCQLPEHRREIVEIQTQRALQEVISQYNAVEVCSGRAMWKVIEPKFFELLETRMRNEFALVLIRERSALSRVIPPEALLQLMRAAAGRLVNRDNLGQFTDAELQRYLKVETIEALKNMPHATPYININEITEPNEPPKQLGQEGRVIPHLSPPPEDKKPAPTPPADDDDNSLLG